jgi:hypothetical protein
MAEATMADAKRRVAVRVTRYGVLRHVDAERERAKVELRPGGAIIWVPLADIEILRAAAPRDEADARAGVLDTPQAV